MALLLLLGSAAAPRATAEAADQREFWWYWDRPASWLPAPPPGVGVAVVTTHVYLSGDRVTRVARRSSLRLPPDVVAMPVIHVEVDPARPLVGTPAQRDAVRDAVLAVTRHHAPGWVQLDFEARRSQRGFWRAVVDATRAGLPPGVRFSVTALASWCHGDRWLDDAPVDEIVPMYFRLGPARPEMEARTAAGAVDPRCTRAYGVADDEAPWPVALPGRRYVFLGKRESRRSDATAHAVR